MGIFNRKARRCGKFGTFQRIACAKERLA